MSLDPDRKRQLHALKLRALARDVIGIDLTEVAGTPDGAFGFASGGADGSVVMASLAEQRAGRALGPALAAAAKRQVTHAHVLSEDRAGELARRAALFTTEITIWGIEGRTARVADPLESLIDPGLPTVGNEILALLDRSGVDIVAEHGVLAAEVEGLEVARVIVDDQGERLEVGVGAHDREAFSIMHGDLPTLDALNQVVDVVRTHRSPGASPHPLNRLGSERWLRSRLIDRPDLVGAVALSSAPPPVPRDNLKEPVPAVAAGTGVDGRAMVVVASTGIDLDVIPFAADARLMLAPEAELVVAVARRDDHAVNRSIADSLRDAARMVVIDDDWREWPASVAVG